MPKFTIKASIDIGGAQVVVVIGKQEIESGDLTILAASKEPCRGLKGGLVTNISEAKLAIIKAVEKAESAAQETVQDLLVAVRGTHIETFNHRGAITINRIEKEITPEDVENVITNAKAIQMAADREILHAAPQDFSIDKQSGVKDPIGMEGSHLAVDVHIAAAAMHPINNITKAIHMAEFNCQQLIYGVYALGDALISPEEKELGVAMIDIGAQTTQIVIYIDGSIRYTKELEIGGELITKDIAYGLKTSFAQAEHLKEIYGLAHIEQMEEDQELSFVAVDGRTKKTEQRQLLIEIIQSRAEEILELILEELHKSNYMDLIPGGIVLTGGASKLQGLDKLAEKVFGINVHLAGTIQAQGSQEILQDPTYATAIGMLKYRNIGQAVEHEKTSSASGALGKIKSWFDDLF